MEDLRPQMPGLEGNTLAMLQRPEWMERMFCHLTINVCSVLSLFIELFLRLWQGTRYIKPPVAVFAVLVQASVLAFSTLGGHYYGSVAAFLLFWALFFRKAFRDGYRMAHRDLEIDSEREGPGWFFLPGEWFVKRSIFEPLTVIAGAILLYALQIINIWLVGFFGLSALALSLKMLMLWYDLFLVDRTARDMRARADAMRQLIAGPPKDEMPEVYRVTPA